MEAYRRDAVTGMHNRKRCSDFECVLRIELSSLKEPGPSVVVVSCA